MKVSNHVCCTNSAGVFGVARQFKAGLLYVHFEDGARWVNPSELHFI